jgi:hypothetical protein
MALDTYIDHAAAGNSVDNSILLLAKLKNFPLIAHTFIGSNRTPSPMYMSYLNP